MKIFAFSVFYSVLNRNMAEAGNFILHHEALFNITQQYARRSLHTKPSVKAEFNFSIIIPLIALFSSAKALPNNE